VPALKRINVIGEEGRKQVGGDRL
jgi:hypothetical protein